MVFCCFLLVFQEVLLGMSYVFLLFLPRVPGKGFLRGLWIDWGDFVDRFGLVKGGLPF